uniref:Link domain-containing protein n=1 Tax=viral metagenome TaxID=1070528 RepID=A0A6C0E9N8_9ZZZZ
MINQTKVIFFLLAGLFAFLFLVFIYYLYAEKFNENAVMDNDYLDLQKPDQLAPEKSTQQNTNNNLNTKTNTSTNVGIFNKKTGTPEKQVFNISENKYTYPEARALCKAFGADLATLEQLMEAYRKGADWCNYGWLDGQLALYPTQKETWEKLQKNDDPEKRKACGNPGLNGGYFDNKDLRFGVSCYGVKPEPRPHEKIKHPLITDADAELHLMIDKFKQDIDNITVLPFNKDKWGAC